MKYPYSRPYLNDADITEVVRVLQHQFLTQGPAVTELETALSETLGAKYAISCNSGTAALHMAYAGSGLGPKAGIIVPAVTFLATANAAKMCGAPVGIADVDPETGNVTAETIKAAVERVDFNVHTIAIVHLGGRACDVSAISAYAKSIGANLIEDACHAPLAQYADETGTLYSVGSCSHSDAATFSFHAIKHITTGEGGALLTNDEELAAFASRFRSHNLVRDPAAMTNSEDAGRPWYYEMHNLGYNYRLSDLNSGLALGQIKRLEENNKRRNELASLYLKHLSNINHLYLPEIPSPDKGQHVWHLFAPRFDFKKLGKPRHIIMNELASKGVGTQVHYIPLYKQPYYSDLRSDAEFSGAESYYTHTMSLPMYFGLGDADIKNIAGILKDVLH